MTKLKSKTEEIKVEVNNLETDDSNIEIVGKNQPNTSIVMYLDANCEDKYFVKFIKATERLIRSNPDYKMYLDFLREENGLDTCAFLKNVTAGKAEIQLHHYPFTLYSICVAVANDMFEKKERISTFILADEVISLHCKDMIGLVPLSCTIHELVHATSIKIPKSKVYGNYLDFYEDYKKYLDQYSDIIKDLEENPYITKQSIKMLENSD